MRPALNSGADVLPVENLKLFANDTNLSVSGVDFRMLNNNCNYCIDALNEWFTIYNYCMHLDVDKANIVVQEQYVSRFFC